MLNSAADRGVEIIKTRMNGTPEDMTPEVYTALIEEAHGRGLKVAVHLYSLREAKGLANAGVDIVAQPPGKKLQSVSLLSGGEKALTATALVFAIFLAKPSPFCVLDEVDAPLDDANIGRFTRMVSEMSARS